MSFFMSSENWEKSHRFVCRFLKTGQKVIGLYVVFYVGEKSHRFVCRFLGRRKTGLGLGFRVRVRVRVRV